MLFQPLSIHLKSLGPSIDFLLTHSLFLRWIFQICLQTARDTIRTRTSAEVLLNCNQLAVLVSFLPHTLGDYILESALFFCLTLIRGRNLSGILLEQQHWSRCVQFCVSGVCLLLLSLSNISESSPTRLLFLFAFVYPPTTIVLNWLIYLVWAMNEGESDKNTNNCN